jgi:quinol monooxygenase YgiN
MVIVQGTFLVKPADRDAYLAQSLENMRVARGEHGCLEYVLAPDPLETNRVVLSERWETTDDLDQHVRALTQRRQEASERGDPPGVALEGQEITIFEVTSARQMG